MFDDWELALTYALSELGAKPDRFVSSGIIQSEYADFLGREGMRGFDGNTES
jgi:hypothetical protein